MFNIAEKLSTVQKSGIDLLLIKISKLVLITYSSVIFLQDTFFFFLLFSAFSSTTEKDENAEERKPNLTTAKVKMKSSFQQSGQHNHPPLSTGKDRCHDGQDMLNVNLEMDQNQLSLLRELCPGASQAELECCFHLAGGNLEEAAQVLLYRQETGTAISATASQPRKVHFSMLTKKKKKKRQNNCGGEREKNPQHLVKNFSFLFYMYLNDI